MALDRRKGLEDEGKVPVSLLSDTEGCVGTLVPGGRLSWDFSGAAGLLDFALPRKNG